MVDVTDPRSPEERPRRRLPRFLRGGLGCFALALGALAGLVLLTPTVASHYAAAVVSNGFEESRRGRLEVEAVELGWFDGQAVRGVRLLDPEGQFVAAGSIELPSLWNLLGERGRLDAVRARFELSLVEDEAGELNLHRALAERTTSASAGADPDDGDDDADGSWTRRLLARGIDLVVEAPRVTWESARTRAAETGASKTLELRDLIFELHHDADVDGAQQPWTARASARVEAETPGALAFDARLERLPTSAEDAPELELRGELQAFPVAFLDALAGGALRETLGDRLDLLAVATGTLDEGFVELSASAPHAGWASTALLSHGRLQVDARQPWSGWVDLPEATTIQAGEVEVVGAPGRLQFEVRGVDLPAAELLAADERGRGLLERLGQSSTFDVVLGLGDWTVRGAPLLEPVLPAGEELALDSLRVLLSVDASADSGSTPARLELRCDPRVPDAEPLHVVLRFPDPPALLRGLEQGGAWEDTRLDVELNQLPLRALDALAEEGAPTWADRLGTSGSARLGLRLSGDPRAARVAADVSFTSEGAATRATVVVGAGKESAAVAAGFGAPPPSGADALAFDCTVPDAASLAPFVPPENEADWSALGAQRVEVRGTLGTAPASTSAEDPEAPRPVLVTVAAGALSLQVTGELTETEFRADGEQGVSATLATTSAVLARLAATLSMPPSTQLVAGEPLALVARDVRWPLEASYPASIDAAHADLRIDLPRLAIAARTPRVLEGRDLGAPRERTTPARGFGDFAAGGADPAPPSAATASDPTSLVLEDVALRARLVPSASGSADATADELELTARTPGGGALRADVRVFDLARGLADGWIAPARLEVDAALERFPTGVVDAYLEQGGLLVDVLGATISGRLRGAISDGGEEPLAGTLDSALGRVELTCRLEDGALVTTGETGVDATLQLTPLVSERVVGNLVPLLVDVTKAPDAEPLRIALRNLRAPLGAGVAGLSADVRLELGEVLYRSLPGLAEFLGEREQRTKTFEPLQLTIRDGAVRYDALPLSIEGEEFFFTGSFDLTTRALDLATELPLQYLGGDAGKLIERYRDRLDPDLAVPITLSGTWPRPRVQIASGFLERAAKSTLKRTFQEGLLELLKKRD